MSNDIVTKGKLHFKAPALVKWAYIDPFKYSVIFKDQKLFINNEGDKSQVDIGSNKMFKELNNLIIKSVKGDLFDDTKFTIDYFKIANGSEVHFSPKDKKLAEFIESFYITFSTKGDVEKIKMIEPSGDYTSIEFSNRTLNATINDTVFNP